MKNRTSNLLVWPACQTMRRLRVNEALAELERAQKVFLESRKQIISGSTSDAELVEQR